MKKILVVVVALALGACSGRVTEDTNMRTVMMATGIGALLGGALGSQVGGVWWVLAGAGAGAYTGYNVGFAIQQSDIDMFNRTAARALSDAGDGETVRWTNTETGNLGTITPTSTYTASDGARCRKFDVMIATAEGAQLGGGSACHVAEGDWAASRGTLG